MPRAPVYFIGSSHADLKALPNEAQRDIGFALHEAQLGGKSFYAKPLKAFRGFSVLEIIDDFDGDTRRRRIDDMTAASDDLIVGGGGKSVFSDIGIPMSPTDMLKVNLAAFVSRIIQEKGMSQARAAQALGIDQPKVSKLLRGRVQEFGIERLLGYVLALGHKIDVHIGSDAKTKREVKLAA